MASLRWLRKDRGRMSRELKARRKRFHAIRKRIHKLKAGIAKRNRQIRAAKTGDRGARATKYLLDRVGRTESPAGSNDSSFLAAWRRGLTSLAWMKGQPWCGFAVIAAYYFGAGGKRLPDGVVYTPNIVAWANRGEGFTRISPGNARAGDLVVFDFPGGSSVADHVGLALGPARNGVIPTVEGNTSPSDAGSQANGGGIFKRNRPVGLIAVVARPK